MTPPEHHSCEGCDAEAPRLLSVADAKRRIVELARPVAGREHLAVRDALGRVLAGDVRAGIDVPPFDNSAMDGFALRSDDLSQSGETELKLVGAAFAGAPYAGRLQRGQAVRIMTGAPIPGGADTVVMQEQAQAQAQAGKDTVRIGPGHRSGQNIRRAGEDVAAGQVVLRAGERITPAWLGLLASLGVAEVTTSRRVRVAFFSTGDELRGVGEHLGPGQIYDSNRYTLHGMLRRLGVDLMDMGVVRDRLRDVRQAFREAADTADAVITSGGVSVGEADYVKQVLEELGEVDFWKIAMKPGKPLAVGTVGDACFFGLPGNPVSVMVTFHQFVRPALRRLMGAAPEPELVIQVPAACPLSKAAGRLEYQRGVLYRDEQGRLRVTTTGLQGSHVLTSMGKANCFIVLPEASEGAEEGELVDVQPFAGLV